MTGNDLFKAAVGYLTQTVVDSEDLTEFVPGWLNVLLAECLPTENARRRYEGLPELASAPAVTQETMGDDIPYREELLRAALPYGLASDFYREDENYSMADEFRARYIGALTEAQRLETESVRNVY